MPKDPVNGPSEVDWDILYAALACMTLSDYYVRWVGGYTGNSFHPTDLAYDKLVEGVSNTTDPAKQRTGFQALQRYETDNAITVPLYYQPLFIFSRDNVNRVGDGNGNMQYSYNWNIVNWEVKPDASGKKILKTNSGPQDFFVHPWFNPGLPIYHKILYDCLLLHDGNLNVAGTGLASSYEVAPDSMSISFTLRNNLKWHDGSPVTVQDIKWSVEYALKIPTLNPIFSTTFNSLQGATEYKAGTARDVTGITTDRNKITFKFAKLDPNLLLTFGQFAPLPQKYFQGVDPAKFQQAPYFQNPVGSGPFMVKEAKMNDYSVYVPFKDYHGGVAKIDEIHATPSWDNDGNLIVNVTSGRVDYGFTKSSGDMIALGKIPGIKIYPVAMLYTRFMYFNTFPRKK
jgi:peptide/nickel transport system substrate-binding protein